MRLWPVAEPIRERVNKYLVPDGDCMLVVGLYVNKRTGYAQMTLGKQYQAALGHPQRTVTVPWLVCRLVHGPPPEGLYVLHSCGRNLCAAEAHLSWGTPLQNILDAIDHGTRRTGENHPNARYSNATVAELRQRVAAGESANRVAPTLGMGVSHAYKILRGEVRNYFETSTP